MEHVVFYPSNEGLPAFERVNSLEAAVSFVEHLRNSDNITEFSVQALTPIPLAFRAYYHVEVPADAASDEAAPAEVDAAEAAASPAAETTELAASAEPAASTDSAEKSAPDEADEDRSAEWVAAASVKETRVAEAPAVEEPATAAAPAGLTPFATAPPVTPAQGTDPFATSAPTAERGGTESEPVLESATAEVVPAPSGRRSMGFFAR
jgi:hypothetical protein